MKKAKRNIIIVTVMLFVCAAVYLNWSYNNSWGRADEAMVEAEDAAMAAALGQEDEAQEAFDYFAEARLTRQTSRDEALSLLQTAAASESASQETIDSAMDAIAAMAQWSMMETQIENLLIARDFADCVAYMTDDGVTVAVPAPAEGLSEADVARITRAAKIRAVLCNGGTAGRLYRRWLEPVTGICAEVLPSTSPANASWSLARLTERWRAALLPALGE